MYHQLHVGVHLSWLPRGITTVYVAIHMIYFLNADITFGFMAASYTVTEGADGQSTVCVELGDGVVERNVTVMISTASGTATSGGQGM